MALPFQHLWRRLWQDPPPTLACEFSEDGIAVAGWSIGATQPDSFAMRPLPPGALRPSPVRENINDPQEVARAVAAAIQDVTRHTRSRREIALLLPDMSARVTVLQFDDLPSKPEDLPPLIRFRLKKTVPFDIEDAAVSYEVKGGEVVAAVTPRAIVRQYETILEDLGYLPGFVTLSTLAGLGLVVSGTGSAGGTMLVRRTGRWMTIVAKGDGALRLMRVSEQATDEQGEVFHDIFSSALFFQDNYGGKVERIFETGFAPAGPPAGALFDQIEGELGVRPRELVIPGSSPEQQGFLGIFGLLAEQARTA